MCVSTKNIHEDVLLALQQLLEKNLTNFVVFRKHNTNHTALVICCEFRPALNNGFGFRDRIWFREFHSEGESAASPEGGSDGDVATHPLHNRLADWKAQASTAVLSSRGCFFLGIGREEQFPVRWTHAHPGVCDGRFNHNV